MIVAGCPEARGGCTARSESAKSFYTMGDWPGVRLALPIGRFGWSYFPWPPHRDRRGASPFSEGAAVRMNTIVPDYRAVTDHKRQAATVALLAELRALRLLKVEADRLSALVWAIGRRPESTPSS